MEVKDIIAPGLKVLFIGFNPGLRSAQTGHHFAGHSNRFWQLLFKAGFTPRLLKAAEDGELLSYGLGISNIVTRPSRTAAEITRAEYQAGREILRRKLEYFRPLVACYAGIGVYREFSGRKDLICGRQTGATVAGVIDFVVPSPSGLNRIPFTTQLAYYEQLQRDYFRVKKE